MLHSDFAESYKNYQQDAIRSLYFGNQCFSIFTTCCCTESSNNNHVRNDVIAVTESFDHDRFASISCVQKVVHKFQYTHEKNNENVLDFFGLIEWGSNIDLPMYLNYH